MPANEALEEASDLVRDVFNRLGAAGLALIVGALVFGAILGATATHRADQIAAQNAASHSQDNKDNQDQQGSAQTEQSQTDMQDKQDSKSTKKTAKAPAKKKSTPAPDHD
jgi:uncharacterized protein HemX